MPDGLYERDVLAWGEQQAELLRRLASGERLNAAVDWPNVIEEVQEVGLSELRACQSLLEQALAYLLKLYALPQSRAEPTGVTRSGHFCTTPNAGSPLPCGDGSVSTGCTRTRLPGGVPPRMMPVSPSLPFRPRVR
ncbi:MAG: DUF29 family protein [Acetobacteraceae bacterium]|nr:DUF29 family protein [Acetobacteraceae bacterium]